jgi:hypothetical protein
VPRLAAGGPTVDGCTFAFEPAWLVVADELPDPDRAGPAVADPYVTALVAANRSGEGERLLEAPAAVEVVRDAVAACPNVWITPFWAGRLGDEEWARFTATHRRTARVGPYGPELWVRTDAGPVTPPG